jgi:hypothetical protein
VPAPSGIEKESTLFCAEIPPKMPHKKNPVTNDFSEFIVLDKMLSLFQQSYAS